MPTKRKKIIKIGAILVVFGLIVGIGVALYLWNLPHRDVQATATDYKVTASELVSEYISDWDGANTKYLATDGNSKVLEVTGTVVRVSENFNGQKVVLLRENGDKAGISFTFLPEKGATAEELNPGQVVTIKGVIRSGVYFDQDLDMFVNAVVEQSDLVSDNG
jgi:hypothetical protein